MNPEEIKQLLEALEAVEGSVAVLPEIKETVDGHGERLEEMQTRLVEVEALYKKRDISLPGVDEEKEEFSFFRAIRAIADKDWSDAGFEKAVFDEARKKALAAGTDTTGGFLVPAEFIAQIIELLRAKSVVIDLGATVMSGLSGSPVEIPRVTGGASIFWIDENKTIPESDVTFGQLQLSPKTVGSMTKLSRRLVNISNPAAEAIVRDDLAKALALGIDLAALRGTGVEGQPQGISNVTGINTVAIGANGGPITIELLYDMLLTLEEDNAEGDRMGFAVHPKVWNKIRQLKDADGRHFIQPDPTQAQRFTLFGWPILKTTQIPTNLTKGSGVNLSEIYWANWPELIIGQWGGMELFASREAGTAFETAQLWVRILQDVDIGLRHVESFCLMNDVDSV